MFALIFATFFAYFPAYVANMAPVIFDKAGWLKNLAVPIDGGRKWRSREIFGPHKTWRGILSGIIGGLITGIFQAFYVFEIKRIPIENSLFSIEQYLLWGALLGLGALVGDLVKSFFKRRLGIPSGKIFFPFDQIDFMLGAALFGLILYEPNWAAFLLLLPLLVLGHLYINIFGYQLKFKKVWW